MEPAGQQELRPPTSAEQLLNLERVGTVMIPDPARPEEASGVLNPASARSRDGTLYLFPRVVAAGNYSRIAMARVTFDDLGNPVGVERLGFALEPREDYERVAPGIGGVEDPRISYIPLLDCYVMTYSAVGPTGVRIALAVSLDLHRWDRLGLLQFEAGGDVDLNRCDNKDCVIFPLPVLDPEGRPSFALIHRPTYPVTRPDGSMEWIAPPGSNDPRPSIWISYAQVERVTGDFRGLTKVGKHQVLAQPVGEWEHHHIGAGAPPILSEEGWLLYYHGVVGTAPAQVRTTSGGLVYQSGVMLLDRDDPRRVLFRSSRPVLVPQETEEKVGIVSNVVFPTGVDVRGQRVDVYYGAADERISAATTRITASLLLAPSAPAPSELNTTSERASSLPHRALGRYDRILVALDGSQLAERVLRSIEPIAQKFGSTLILLRAVTSESDSMAAPPAPGAATASATAAIHQGAEAYLNGIRQRLTATGLNVECECPEGPAGDVILQRAREGDIDLIALTTHGRTGIDRLLLGSIAEEVIRRAPCPVHLVRVLSPPD